ncbi:MAG: PLP-dependent aminotransferase family protein [Acidobacteria bacterium]|nr:PLP-dependent aminotransferase family protein [Acidobacteriota bacterium]
MEIKVDTKSPVPLYLQIKNGIAEQILVGKLQPGDRLPATRELARRLGVNRSTVTNAYDELLADGLLSSHVGQGTFVTIQSLKVESKKDLILEPLKWQKMVWDGLFAGEAEGRTISALLDLYQVSTIMDVISFSGSFPDESSFPIAEFKSSLNHALKEFGKSVLKYEQAAGLQALREHLATDMRSRNIITTPENILITNGSQQAIDLLARSFISPGDRVVVENPTYPGATNSFASLGAKLTGIPIDSQGMQIDSLEQIIVQQHPKLIYLIPTFHNPTGYTLSLERRHQLMDLVRKYKIPVLEDAYGEDLRYEGREIPSLKALDVTEQVIYFGTFSKNLLPGIRIGWCVAPSAVFTRLVALKQIGDITTSPLLQAALWDFCRRRRYQAHLERVRVIYRRRRDFMVSKLQSYFPLGTQWSEPQGGLFCWVKLPNKVDTTELLIEARQQGVVFSRGHLFHIDGSGQNTLRLSFGNLTEIELDKGLKILGSIATKLLHRSEERTPDKFRKNTLPLV